MFTTRNIVIAVVVIVAVVSAFLYFKPAAKKVEPQKPAVTQPAKPADKPATTQPAKPDEKKK